LLPIEVGNTLLVQVFQYLLTIMDIVYIEID
jgi:hypothetical protein